jgi:hypothetical protein
MNRRCDPPPPIAQPVPRPLKRTRIYGSQPSLMRPSVSGFTSDGPPSSKVAPRNTPYKPILNPNKRLNKTINRIAGHPPFCEGVAGYTAN